MPTPAVIDRHDTKMVAPDKWSEEHSGHCGTLPIRHEQIGGVQFMRSAWDVENDELLRLLCGARLILGVAGECHPVVHLEVAPLPCDYVPAFTVRQFVTNGGVRAVHVETLLFIGGHGKRLWCEQPIDEGGRAIAIGRCIELIEELARTNGWPL